MQNYPKNRLQNHIQVLRCFSVFIVFFYHLNIPIFFNGYLGVDIFFLISGYVITMMLYKEHLQSQNLNILNFWIKRFKRIYPVLIFVFFTTVLLYFFFGPFYLITGIVKEFFYSVFGLANFYFLFNKVDYFNDLNSSPFLHSWSLSIEEQFYFIYPFIFLFIFVLKI